MRRGSFFRIHSASEPLDTLLDPSRKDGWVADDEAPETQPIGISCCVDLEKLRRYVRHYSMSVRPGDQVVRLVGTLSDDRDRDENAERVIVESYEVLGDAQAWLRGDLTLDD